MAAQSTSFVWLSDVTSVLCRRFRHSRMRSINVRALQDSVVG